MNDDDDSSCSLRQRGEEWKRGGIGTWRRRCCVVERVVSEGVAVSGDVNHD